MDYPAYQTLLFTQENNVATVAINNPERRNAWSDTTSREIADVFTRMDDDESVRVAILTGNQEGKAFSAGADLKDPNAHQAKTIGGGLDRAHKITRRAFDAVHGCSKPIIAAVNGYAIGIGCQICLCCDILYAAEGAEMGMPQVALGIMPAYAGAPRMARFVGKGKAMEMALLGERLTAEDGYRLGLYSKVVPLADLMSLARKTAEKLANQPPLAVRLTKESVSRGMDIPNVNDAGVADVYRFLLLELTEDNKEAHAAWREKRQPVFKGR